MSKYILKKDLPFAKAGIKIEQIQMSNTALKSYDLFSNNEVRFWINTEKDLDYLISEGWIEEIKPREWWVLKPKDHSTAGQNVRFYKNPTYARDDYEKEVNESWFEIIKVREVIE